MKIKQDISSLDASIRDDEEESVLADFIEDTESISPEESATGQLLKEQMDRILELVLTERERKIVRLRNGMEDGEQHTLEEVGHIFGVTRERIRQIEAKSYAKIRKNKEASKMRDYMQ